jgi:hypothetical protein
LRGAGTEQVGDDGGPLVLTDQPELARDEAAGPGQPRERGVLRVERREQLPAPVDAGDVRE